MDIEVRGGHARGQTLGLFGIAIAVGLALVDFVVLRGEHVGDATIQLYAKEPARIEIDRVGEEHLVEISTRLRRGGESKGRSVHYRLEDPEGRLLVEESEIVSRKRRFVRFEPGMAGAYRIFVEDPGLIGPGNGTARVSVYVNDRRLFARFLPFF